MFARFKSWMQVHIWKTIISVSTVSMVGAVGIYSNVYEARVNRIEEMKVSEFNELVSETKKFREMLNLFTAELAVEGVADAQKRADLSTSLVRLYSGLSAFSVNIPAEKEAPIRQLQTSINDVKKNIQVTRKKEDLDTLGVSLINMFRDFKTAQPIIEGAVGKEFPVKT